MSTSMENITAKQNVPPPRVNEASTSEGIPQGQRVVSTPLVITTTNLKAPVVIQTVLRTHHCTTRYIIPGITLAIHRPAIQAGKLPCLNPILVQDAPACTNVLNSNRNPLFSHRNMISQEAVNIVTQRMCDTPGENAHQETSWVIA